MILDHCGSCSSFRLIKQGRRDRGPSVAKTGRTANPALRSIGPCGIAAFQIPAFPAGQPPALKMRRLRKKKDRIAA
jgi:hypothetical protein